MNAKGPPRLRGLLLALIAVLVLMGYAFWRASAGPDVGRSARQETAEPSGTAGATPAGAPDGRSKEPAIGREGGLGGGPPANAGPAAAAPPRDLDEGRLMARLRAIKDSDPAAAVTLAREGNRRFPDSAGAPERTSILVHALAATDRSSEARGEAEQMVNHYPDSDWVREVERFTGAHRHRNASVNDAGQLIFR